ncbi:hypothetical protein AGABI1DRAFT_133218 [Agaricus bisporus var. burnettii JB137-S8]|uniref:Uncharacterized protein n=1 Tax=Agaricus bisporus var. burnettii (strain JB137-S8 / ATCC MYA-4627 / FGSC 10392) TaxID=597362 RepID=K5WUN3_AGABU|nr:uncharacterized protein AGABI1DRAFT_133218 [Agaricus bisporus var. burnettii JB137-S8]EKM74473.1 hypothetical protein AGABI1DRAFT_133218 [Agaricus bisporus var. burnettii JB137-S8]
MADHRDRPYPAPRLSRPPSPTGSRCEIIYQVSWDTQTEEKNFIEAGLEEVAAKEKTLMERADAEIVPTSQEYEKELDEIREEMLALRRRKNAEDSDDDEEVAESSDEENDDAKAAAVPSQTETNLWNQFSTPPAGTHDDSAAPLPSRCVSNDNACTPPRSHEVLPDLDKTPTTPRVMKITKAEAYALKVRAANDTDAHVMTGVNMLE